jgi:hypothetical protein
MKPSICLHLRTKKMYIPAQAAEASAAFESREAIGPCWCNLTQSPIGPDDQLVHPESCRPGRACCAGIADLLAHQSAT